MSKTYIVTQTLTTKETYDYEIQANSEKDAYFRFNKLHQENELPNAMPKTHEVIEQHCSSIRRKEPDKIIQQLFLCSDITKTQMRGIISDLRNHAANWESECFTTDHGDCLRELADILEDHFDNSTTITIDLKEITR
jgi:hypothetical protein